MQQDSSIEKENGIGAYFKKRMMIRPPVDKDPRDISPRMKSIIVACVALVSCTAGFSSTIYFPGLPFVTRDLNATPITTTLTAAFFILFMSISPVVWASISEYFHIRRFLFLTAMIIFVATSIGAVFVQNIWILVVVRCIQSTGVSSGQSVGAGYISDLYPIEQRGRAFGRYMFGVNIGPSLGPIVGGFLIMSQLEWRATFWFCAAFGVFIFMVTFFFTPETYRDDAKFDLDLPTTTIQANNRNDIPEKRLNDAAAAADDDDDDANSTISDSSSTSTIIDPRASSENLKGTKNEKQAQDQEEKYKQNIETQKKKKKFNPFAGFALLCHPFVLLPSIAGGFFFGAMFATEAILPGAFESTYGLTSWQTGLCYLGAGIGNLSGALVGSRLSDRLLLRSRRLRGGEAKSEDRLTLNIWVAGFFFNPLGLLIFGWVVQHKLSFWGAVVGFGIQGFGTIQVITSVAAYLVDSMPGRGAGAAAAANFVRFLFSCILTLISTPMVEKLGAGWTATLFACLSWLGMVLLLTIKIWGERIRAWSGY